MFKFTSCSCVSMTRIRALKTSTTLHLHLFPFQHQLQRVTTNLYFSSRYYCKLLQILNNKPFDSPCHTISVAATSLKHSTVVKPIQQSSLPTCYLWCSLIMNHQKQHFRHFSKQSASKVTEESFQEIQTCSISGYVEHQLSVLMHHQILSLFNLNLNFQHGPLFIVLCCCLNVCILQLQIPSG